MTRSFETMRTVLDRLGVPLGVSEVHGVLCGLVCSDSATAAKSRWFAEMLDAAGLTSDSVASLAEPIRELDSWFTDTIESLNDAELRFEPLLPDESSTLSMRTDSLGEFCGGFCYGVGLGAARRGNVPLPADTRELIEDFQAIDGANVDDAVDAGRDQDEENALAELIEYVRVGVLLVLEELKPVQPIQSPEQRSASPDDARVDLGPPPLH